jgi:two-component system, OmpR family, sensor kinase
MPPASLLRAPVAVRIYLVGLAQMAVVAVGFGALLELNRPAGIGPFGAQARYVAGNITRSLGDTSGLFTEVQRAHEQLQATITVIDPDGAIAATSAPPGAPRCFRQEAGARGADGGPRCHTEELRFPDGRIGHMEYATPPWRPPPLGTPVFVLVLVVVGVSSLLLARTLTSPLRRLSSAARAFGGGDLAARVALDRRDEFGDVARAFDEMAGRVTELLRAEKELLANISHELRTPLARIRVALDIAAEGDADAARESLFEITDDLDELERLISDVLTTARLDLADGASPAGIPPLRRQDIDVAALLEQSVTRFRAAHPDRELRVEAAEVLPSVNGDPVLLRRVIDNLLDNAHKYTDRPDASIDLVASGGDGVLIEVVDRGVGISSDDLPLVFRPFFRADKSRTRATGGLGLGLALAKRIVDAHGGSLELVSSPSEGTRARVRLPREPAAGGG